MSNILQSVTLDWLGSSQAGIPRWQERHRNTEKLCRAGRVSEAEMWLGRVSRCCCCFHDPELMQPNAAFTP